jgi:hypothetical protein
MYLLMVARQSGFEYTATLTHRAAKFRPAINSCKPIFTLAEAIHRAAVNSAVAGIPAFVHYLQKLCLCAPSPERADSIALV